MPRVGAQSRPYTCCTAMAPGILLHGVRVRSHWCLIQFADALGSRASSLVCWTSRVRSETAQCFRVEGHGFSRFSEPLDV